MPDILDQMISQIFDPDKKITFTPLRDCFLGYYTTPIDPDVLPDIQWIGYNSATNYPVAQDTLQELTENLFNRASLDVLYKKLEKI